MEETNSKIIQLCKMLDANDPKLTSLDLRYNKIGEAEVTALAKALKSNTNLTSLNLHHNQIGNTGVQALIQTLEHNASVKRLGLGNNEIGDAGATILAKVFKHNTSVSRLGLGGNKIGDAGAITLAKALEHNTTVTNLGLWGNKIGNAGVEALANALKYNTTLTALELGNNRKIENKWKKTIKDYLARNKQLRNRFLSSTAAKGEIATVKQLLPQHKKVESFSQQKITPSVSSVLYEKFSPLDKQEEKKLPPIKELPLRKELQTIAHDELTYDNNKPIGSGAFGNVYHGKWHTRDVAIKALKDTHLPEVAVKEFKKEARILAKLNSPYIVHSFGISQQGSQYMLIMEYCSKGSLYHYLHSNAVIAWSQRRQWGQEIILGVAYLHDHKVLHNDLACRNVLLDEKYRAKLSDFGLSETKNYTQNSSGVKSGSQQAAFAWTAPERFSGNNQASEKTDIYSYGITLGEIVTRQNPLSGKDLKGLDAMGKIFKVLQGYRDPIPPETPAPFKQIIVECCDKRPDKRPDAKSVVQQWKQAKQSTSSLQMFPVPPASQSTTTAQIKCQVQPLTPNFNG